MQAGVNLKVSVLLRRAVLVSVMDNDPRMQKRAEGRIFDPLAGDQPCLSGLPHPKGSLGGVLAPGVQSCPCWWSAAKQVRMVRNGSPTLQGRRKHWKQKTGFLNFAPHPSLLDQLSRGGSQTCPFGFAGCKDPNPGWPVDRSLPKCRDKHWTEIVQKTFSGICRDNTRENMSEWVSLSWGLLFTKELKARNEVVLWWTWNAGIKFGFIIEVAYFKCNGSAQKCIP